MRRSRILVAEDIYETLIGTLRELESQGATVDHVENVNDTLARLREMPYDLLLLDWRLPIEPAGPVLDNAGRRVLDGLKSGELGAMNAQIPIIILTNQSRAIDLGSGANYPQVRGIVAKLRIDLFESLVKEVLEQDKVVEVPR